MFVLHKQTVIFEAGKPKWRRCEVWMCLVVKVKSDVDFNNIV